MKTKYTTPQTECEWHLPMSILLASGNIEEEYERYGLDNPENAR